MRLTSPGRGDISTAWLGSILAPLPWLVHLFTLRGPTAFAVGHIIPPAEAGFQMPPSLG